MLKNLKKTVNAFKFLAKLNLITDSFVKYKLFKVLFPESDSIISELDLGAFSKKGKFRFRMIKWGLAPIFIIMFKIKKFFRA